MADRKDLLDQQSDDSFQFFDLSPPWLDEFKQTHEGNHAGVESNHVENALADFNPFSMEESFDLFDISSLSHDGENTQAPNSSPQTNPLSDDFFEFSPTNFLEEETNQAENPSGEYNPFSWDEGLGFLNFSPPRAQVGRIVEGWSYVENKEFENALAKIDPNSPTFYEELASRVPSKSLDDIKAHYQKLVEDIALIEAGQIEPPVYLDEQQKLMEMATRAGDGGTGSSSKQKNRGTLWTKEEHELFLKGLEEYGKGDWRSISRYCVLSKTPTQIASHAQKFFRKQERKSKKSSAGASSSTAATRRNRRKSSHNNRKVATPTTIPISAPPISVTNLEQPPVLPPSAMINSRGFLNYHGSNFSRPPFTTTAAIPIPPPNPNNVSLRNAQPSFPHTSRNFTFPPPTTSTFLLPTPNHNLNPPQTEQEVELPPFPPQLELSDFPYDHNFNVLPPLTTNQIMEQGVELPPFPYSNITFPAPPPPPSNPNISTLHPPRSSNPYDNNNEQEQNRRLARYYRSIFPPMASAGHHRRPPIIGYRLLLLHQHSPPHFLHQEIGSGINY